MTRETLLDQLWHLAHTRPDATALTVLDDDHPEGLACTYRQLWSRAEHCASRLSTLAGPGDRVMLVMDTGMRYVSAFLGCLLARMVAVPAFPPESLRPQHLARLSAIAKDAQPRVAVIDTALSRGWAEALPAGQLPTLDLSSDEVADGAAASAFARPAIRPENLAFLQYTSGSTATPKGVMVTHGNIVANQHAIASQFGTTADDIMVSWLPLYHDMGLIGSLLHPLYMGVPLVLMSPGYFLQRPRRWLDAIERFGATISGGPDFAYRLCVERIRPAQAEALSLGSWRIAFCGAEPIRPDTLQAFADRFSAAGLDPGALYPCYGLAEATLLVSGGRPGAGATVTAFDDAALAAARVIGGAEGMRLVACGDTAPGHRVEIRDPETGRAVADGAIGELCISGPSVTAGYWQRPDATAQVFGEDGTWLRSGDLGFRHDGQLYIAGRLKDLIVVRGHNLYPQDIEIAVEAGVDIVRKGRVAAFPVTVAGAETIGIAAEIARGALKFGSPEAVERAIRETVAQACGEPPGLVLLLMPGELPKTTSGKLQRSRCLPAWRAGELQVWAAFEAGKRAGDESSPPGSSVPAFTATQARLAALWHEVLGVAPSTPRDSFFALGGDSVKAVQLVARIRERLHAGYALQDLFAEPALRDGAAMLDRLCADGSVAAQSKIARQQRDGDAPLSAAQRGLWVLWCMQPDSGAYNVSGVLKLQGRFDDEALRRTVDALVARHEALRTIIALDQHEEPRQRVLASYRCDIATLDLRAAGQSGDADSNGEGNAEYLARSRARTLSEQPFDLLAAPALRIARLRVADEREWLSITMHHIVSDGWSMNVLIDEFARLYEGFARGNPVQLPALPIRYTDYAAWHRDRLDGGELERQLAYWKSSLGSEPVVLDLPCDRARPAVPSHRGSAVDFSVAPALAGRLRALARQADTTLFTVLLAAYKVLLHRHTGQRDLRVGVPAANRSHVDTEGLVGFFVNTQVLRTEIDGTLPFATVLTRVREAVLEAQANQDVPFELVVDALQPDRNLAHNPLFQVKFNQALAIAAPARLAGHAVEAEQIEGDVTRFDLALDVSDQQTTISARFSYATDLFERETVQRLQGHYVAILEQVANDPQGVVGALALPCGTDGRLIAEASAEAVDVVTAWRRNVAEAPCAVALQVGDATLTRLQVDRLANAVGQALVARGVGVESTVGLCVERSFAFAIGWLGILKAGAACVPLDPAQPVERLRQLLEDAGAGVVVGRLEGVESIDPDGLAPVDLAPAVTVVPDQAAYLIYTSGSTGTPKGVVVRHGALAHYVCGVLQRLNLPADASMAMVSTTAADLGHTVLFGALYSGRTLHLLPHDHAFDPDRFAAYMARHRVGVLKIVPSHLRALLQAGKPADVLPHAALILGGEATSADLAQTIRDLRPECQLFNHYGPTETTVGVLTHHAAALEDGPVPTGKPLPGSHVYVLDADLNPVPAGVAGELYIGGPQVARGYLNRPGLTAERFLPDPFVAGARMYRTGDRVKEDRQGRIHYLGRADEQVKVRGYRVEPGEIAHMLRTQAGVVDAAVLVRDEKLVAYCVLTNTDPATLKAALKAHLPDHMVPAQIVPMDRLPVTPNGKLDRRALPEPVWETQGYVAPRNDTEALLAQVWQDVLGVEKVGITDNFFELGGDSILSIQAVSRARRAGLRFTPKDLFLHQSVQALAQVATAVKSASVRQAVPRGDVPLLPVQTAFFESAIPNRHHWNQSALLRPVKPLDTSVLDRALHAVVAHHDALRLSFTQVDGQWKQHYADAVPADLLWQQSVADTAELTDACCRAQQSLRLDSGPLLRALHLRLPDGTERLFLAIHHLAVDGVSWRILLEDLQAAYAQAAHNQAIVLTARTTSYQAWARALIAYARQDAVLKHVGYWLAQQAPALPCDRQPHQDRIADADTLTLRLSPERTRLLLTQAHAAYRTQINDLLLSALSQALGQWAGTDRAGILLEGHGREALSESTDLSRTVGWFTTVFPVALPVLHDPAQSIRQVKEALRAIPANGLGYGLLRYLGPEAVRHELAALDLPRLTFNYLGQFDQGFGVDALFARASEPHGPPRSADAPLGNWITVNGQVAAGALELDFAFSTARYDRDTVAALVRACEAALDATIDHCLQAPAGALTPSDVPLAALTQAQLDRLPLDHGQVDDLYPLTPMQQGMLFHTLYTPEAGIYVNQLAITLDGLDASRFQRAWDEAVARHEILRTSFIQLDGQALQAVHRHVPSPVCIEDAIESSVDAIALNERQRPFALDTAPLMRVRLVRTAPQRYRMIWTSHHLLLDGWSTACLIGEVLQRYHGQTPPASPGRYRDHIAWLQQQDASASEAFWRQRLQALDMPTRLADAIPVRHPAKGHAVCRTSLDAAALATLQRCAQQQHLTLNTLLQAAWIVVLQRYTGQRAVAFGATVSGRPAALPGADTMLGLFINTLPVIQAPSPEQSIGGWLQALQAENIALREHEHVPLFDIQRWAGLGGQALFDSILVFENYPVDAALRERNQHGLQLGDVDHAATTNYPLTLVVSAGETLEIVCSYAADLFDAGTIERVQGHYVAILERIAAGPDALVGTLTLLDGVEQQQLRDWNAADARFRHADPVHVAIARRARMQPDAVAVRCGNKFMSYAELDAASHRLALSLHNAGVGPETVVGVALDRSPELLVRLLAVLKAGAAYLPLDPELPSHRIAYLLDDARVSMILTTGDLVDRIPSGLPTVLMEDAGEEDGTLPSVSPHQLAYLIYTSGSTGTPKGVAVEHGPLAMHCHATAVQYGMTPDDRELHFLSFNFDGAHERWLVPLIAGAQVVLRDDELWSAEQTLDAFRQHGVTNAGFPPAYLQRLAEAATPGSISMRLLSFGGEAMSRESFARIRRTFGARTLINGYGPTEAVVTPLAWVASPEDECTAPYVPIGRPVGTRTAYVLDADLNPVPVGVTGELYIGGFGLARGYVGKPGLTAERFLPDPFATGARMYRTGDLVRRAADGNIEYVGRLDHQVKIRGYRIEPGEIEARLRAHPAVREAVVVPHDGPGGKQLVAYVVPTDPQDDPAAAVRRHLEDCLPPYMVPAQCITLARLPVTGNGKLDRRALPEPVWETQGYVAPRNDTETLLAQVWQEVLGVEKVGITDNFFELGGHSLLLTRLVSRLRADLGVTLTLREAMELPTVEQLALWVAMRKPSEQKAAAAQQLQTFDDLMADLEAS